MIILAHCQNFFLLFSFLLATLYLITAVILLLKHR